MSILIKGMEMPTKHFIKGFYIDGETGNILDISRKSIIGHAVEVPTPHGRLIDANEVVEEIVKAIPWYMGMDKDKSNNIYVDGLLRADEIVENAPTVIEGDTE